MGSELLSKLTLKLHTVKVMYKIAVLASTRGTNLQSLVDAQKAGDLQVEISCLITNKADCGAVEKAEAAGIPVHVLETKDKDERDLEMIQILSGYGVDLVVLGGYMRLLGKAMVEAYPNRILNIHPSLLPKHTGMDLNVHQAVLDAGEAETGMTIHFVDEGIDTGQILLQKSTPVEEGETAESLKKKVQELEKEWYPKVIQDFADGKFA